MRKAITILLALLMVLSLMACGGGSQTTPVTEPTQLPDATPEPTPQSAIDALNENERLLFDALIKFTTSSFHNPSSVRVIEVGDYQDFTTFDKKSADYGTAIVVVRLQADNQAGGSINCNYVICIRAAETNDEANKARYELAVSAIKRGNDVDANTIKKMTYKAEFAEYGVLSDNYKIKRDASKKFGIANINKAIKEYWEDMGF